MIVNRIVYLMSGPAHLPYLVCSLVTLRRHWSGPVTVHAWEESGQLARRICADPRLNIEFCPRVPDYRGKNDQFLDKIQLIQSHPSSDVVLYLDADTTIHGRLDDLFESAVMFGFTATQFNDWRAGSRLMAGRLRELFAFPQINPHLVERAIVTNMLSVNGGIWCARPDSPVLKMWYNWTMEANSTFIADEKVLHLMVLHWEQTGEIDVLAGGRWNCSPKYQPSYLTDEQVVIRHYHGDSCVRPSKSQRGFDLWFPVFRRCVMDNVGGIADWWNGVGNKWMSRMNLKQVLEKSLQ